MLLYNLRKFSAILFNSNHTAYCKMAFTYIIDQSSLKTREKKKNYRLVIDIEGGFAA